MTVNDGMSNGVNAMSAQTGPVVTIQIEGGHLVARLASPPDDPTAAFAFYLRHNGRRVEMQGYGAESVARFRFALAPGRYEATAFIRGTDGQTTTISTDRLRLTEDLVVALSTNAVRPSGGTPGLSPSAPAERERLPPPARLEDFGSLRVPSAAGVPRQFVIDHDGLRYCGLMGEPRGDRLFVLLGGAVPNRSRITLPRFSRFSWRHDFPGTALCLADPTLFLSRSLRLGWFVGDSKRDATQGCVSLVREVASSLRIRSDRIVFWGASGGGFAALQMAAAMGEGATAVAINPQTSILRYGIATSRQEFVSCFGGGQEAFSGEALLRVDATKRWSSANCDARALLFQNIRDRHHHKEHFADFMKSAGSNCAHGRVLAVVYDDPARHSAESRSIVPYLLNAIGMLEAGRHGSMDLSDLLLDPGSAFGGEAGMAEGRS